MLQRKLVVDKVPSLFQDHKTMSQFRAPGISMILRQTSCWMKNLFQDLKPYSIWKLLSGSQGMVSLNRFKPTDYKEYLDTFTICLKITSVSCRQNAFTRITVLWIRIKNIWTLRSNHTWMVKLSVKSIHRSWKLIRFMAGPECEEQGTELRHWQSLCFQGHPT